MPGDIQRTIEILFSATDNASATIGRVGDSLESFGSGLGDIAGPFADAAAGAEMLEAAVLAVGGALLRWKEDIKNVSGEMEAALGISEEKAAEVSDAVRAVFSEGFGLEESTGAITEAFRQLKTDSIAELAGIGEHIVEISRLFGADFKEQVDAANSYVKNFGTTNEEAFDLIAAGFQKGLDSSGDYLDTVREYGNLFKDAGFTAEEFFSLLETGNANGVLGTDKIADAVKELGIVLTEGGKKAEDAFGGMGLSYEQIRKDMEAGKLTVKDVFELIVQKAKEAGPANLDFQKSVSGIGTQFEDLGSVIRDVDLGATKMEDVVGSADKAGKAFDTLGQAASAAANTAMDAFANTGAFDDFIDRLKSGLEGLKDNFPDALDGVDFSGLEGAFDGLLDAGRGALENLFGDVDLSTADGLESAIQTVVDALTNLQNFIKGVVEAFDPLTSAVGAAVGWFGQLDGETVELMGNVGGAAQQLAGLAGAVATGGALLSGFSALTKAIGPSGLGGAIPGVSGKITGLVGVLGKAGLAGAALEAGLALGGMMRNIPGMDEFAQNMFQAFDDLISGEAFEGAFTMPVQVDKTSLDDVKQVFKDLEAEEAVKTVTASTMDAVMALNEFEADMERAVPDEKTTEIDAKTGTGVEKAEKEIDHAAEDRKAEIAAKAELAQAKADMDRFKAENDRLEIEADLEKARIDRDIESIRSNAETVQKAMEYRAEVDIAQAEIQLHALEAAFSAISEEFSAATDAVSTMASSIGTIMGSVEAPDLSGLPDIDLSVEITADMTTEQIEAVQSMMSDKENLLRDLAGSQFSNTMRIAEMKKDTADKMYKKMDDENKIRMRLIEQQQQLVDNGMQIKVDTTEFNPHLQAIMISLFEAMQDQIVAEGGNVLIGLLSGTGEIV